MLVDFIVERSEVHPQGFGDERWILETYRSSQVQGGGVAMVLRKLEGSTIAQAVKLTYTVSNNEVEYEAVLLQLRVAKQLSIAAIELRCDS